jgi:hypothetical protein
MQLTLGQVLPSEVQPIGPLPFAYILFSADALLPKMGIETDYEKLVSEIVSNLVNRPEAVTIESVFADGKKIIRVHVHP